MMKIEKSKLNILIWIAALCFFIVILAIDSVPGIVKFKMSIGLFICWIIYLFKTGRGKNYDEF